MKIIDLFVKIAKGEKVPNEIKYLDMIFEFDENIRQYYQKGGRHVADCSLRMLLSDFNDLNDEVELTDEIEKIVILTDNKSMPFVANNEEQLLSYSEVDLMFANRINKLIEEINKLKGGK